MKTCVTCHVHKPLDDLNVMSRSRDGRQPRCRDCCKLWYQANKEVHKRNVAVRGERVRNERVGQLNAYLARLSCVDCGEADVRVLDLDHRPGEHKRASVSVMAFAGTSWELILEEIAKCDVRCANCHRRRTVERAGFRRQAVHERAVAERRDAAVLRLRHLLAPGPSEAG